MNRLGKLFGVVCERILPNRCLSCGEYCDDTLCEDCSRRVLAETVRECEICGQRLSMCGCMPESLRNAGCTSFRYVFYYDKHSDDVSRNILLRLKTNDSRAGFKFLASLMAASLGDMSGWTVTNVPRRKSAVREYGFDQAERLARELADILGCEYMPLLTHRGDSEQKQLNSEQRIEAARISYGIRDKKCSGRRVLLVDDIVTSGATAAECTRLLLENGAAKVYITSAARSHSGNTEELHT